MTNCTATLQRKELWQQFHDLDTEMIITKSGRRMFPALRVQVYQLDPQAHYCILLEMVPVGNCRYKYSASNGWAPAGAEEAQSPHRVYLHPESPATGEYWMWQPISFGKVKLTNTPAPPPGHLVLSSMHKYQPRIIIVKASDPRAVAWAPTTSVVFPETQFIAVTAYQNEKITKLKIDHNPFAKGFRENGHSKCKRKRLAAEQQITAEERKDKRPTPERSISPIRIDVSDERSSSGSLTPELINCESSPLSRRLSACQTYYHYPSYQQNYDWYSYYLSYYRYNSPQFIYPVNYQASPSIETKPKQVSRKFTDFSIDSIMGI